MQTNAPVIYRSRWSTLVWIILVIAVLGVFGLARANSSPSNKSQSIFHIEQGETVTTIAAHLEQEDFIRSANFFKVVVRLLGTATTMAPGDYKFPAGTGAIGIAQKVGHGVFGIPVVKVTIPEGSTNEEIATILGKKIKDFPMREFLAVARPHEGYLFPDTYFFSEVVQPQVIIDTMRTNFEVQMQKLSPSILLSRRPLAQIVTMASIIEKEVRTPETRAIVAGILWKRLDTNMPLQVDASFSYLLHKSSRQLTAADLNLDSPYNTYRYKGLPPTPISNAGVEAIHAVLFPQTTPYFFYLSDKAGALHYAVDFEGHKRNKAKYLN